ncbi:carbonic anhydrase 4 [Eleutherodactylus coqui]|uniref:carbonic anhydrase 4 n=1 Tax=Eleutherodactylus coqui TaxID=57060 RepID=UPI003462CB88
MTFNYLFFSFTLHLMTYSSADEWCYDIQAQSEPLCNVPSKWNNISASCTQRKQSPIDIITCHATFDPNLKPFKFDGYDKERELKLENNGHSVELTLADQEAIQITGGGLPGTYVATQLHFHWGNESKSGSEHYLNGEQYAMELHIVHKRKAGSDTRGRSTATSELAVLGFFYDVGLPNNGYNNLTKALERITLPAQSTVLRVRLQDLIPKEEQLKLFYRYEGSLTTPHCNETVIWTVFPAIIQLNKSQINAFSKNLRYSKDQEMIANFRPIQSRNGRTIFTSGVDAVLPNARYLLITLFVFYVTSIRGSAFTFNSC